MSETPLPLDLVARIALVAHTSGLTAALDALALALGYDRAELCRVDAGGDAPIDRPGAHAVRLPLMLGELVAVVVLHAQTPRPTPDRALSHALGTTLAVALASAEARTLTRREAVSSSRAHQRVRDRSAARLHDEIAQDLVAARMKALVMRQDGANVPALDFVVGCLDHSLAVLRDLMRALAPYPPPDRLGLVAALRGLARESARRFGVEVAISAPGEAAHDVVGALRPPLFALLMSVFEGAGAAGVAQLTLQVDTLAESLVLTLCPDLELGAVPFPIGVDLDGLAEQLSWSGGELAIDRAAARLVVRLPRAPAD